MVGLTHLIKIWIVAFFRRGCVKPDYPAVPDPDLEITGGRGGGVGFLAKKIFRPFGPQFGPKIRGALSWIRHCSEKNPLEQG